MTLSNRLFRNRTHDSLEYARQAHALFSAQNNTWKVAHSLMGMGSCQFLLAHYKEALVALDESLVLFEACGDMLMCAKVRQYQGGVYVYTGEYFAALRLFQKNLEVFTLPEHRDWAIMARNYISGIYGTLGHYDKALETYLDTLALAQQGEVSAYVDRCMYNIATIYMRMNDFTRAIEYATIAAQLYEKNGDKRGWALAQQTAAHAYTGLGKAKESIVCVLRAEEIFHALSATDNLADMQLCRGNIALLTDDTTLALQCFTTAQTMGEQTENKAIIGSSKAYIGKVYVRMKQYKKALGYCLAAKEMFESFGDRHLLYSVCEQLSELYEATGDLGKALHYRKWYGELKEEIVGMKKQQALADIHIRKELDAIEREREAYQKKSAVLEQEVVRTTKALTETSLRLVQKNAAIRQVAQQLQKVADAEYSRENGALQPLMQQVEQAGSSEEAWQLFEREFEHLYNGYRTQLLRHCPALSPMELKVCTLLKLNLLSKEIAQILWLSPRTVDRHRYNIRKKLHLAPDNNLVTYLARLGL